MPEFRCTRPTKYPPHTPDSGMQGHYVQAASETQAVLIMHARFPEDGGVFHITHWRDLPASVEARIYTAKMPHFPEDA